MFAWGIFRHITPRERALAEIEEHKRLFYDASRNVAQFQAQVDHSVKEATRLQEMVKRIDELDGPKPAPELPVTRFSVDIPLPFVLLAIAVTVGLTIYRYYA